MRCGSGKRFFVVSVLLLFQLHPVLAQSVPETTLIEYTSSISCGLYQVPDTDRDFLPDAVETDADTDNDGIPNYLDNDSDNDGLPDALEAGPYVKPWLVGGYQGYGTGCMERYWGANIYPRGSTSITQGNLLVGSTYFPFPFDLDGNGVADIVRDANENNVADFLEPASAAYTLDNDPCIAEGGYTDTDRDLIADVYEGSVDTDGDGIPNYLDTDSDNDGLSDYWERKYTTDDDDYDFDGITQDADVNNRDSSIVCIVMDLPDPADRNVNGIQDYLEPATYAGINDPCAVFGGGTDTDGDWIIDSIETDADTDSDGIPNYLDLDSDNDGLSDRYEYNRNEADIRRLDFDKDGVIFQYDIDHTNSQISCLPLTNPAPDYQNDGIPDFLTPDSDGDSLPDPEEILYGGALTLDADRDNLSDKYEVDAGYNPGNPDTDGGGANDDWEVLMGSDPTDASDDAGLPIDLDVDNDGIADVLETAGANVAIPDSDGDGRSDTQEAGLPDADNDGIIDNQTDVNLNGIADIGEALTELPDFDGDTVPDLLDVDSDNDGVGDKWEHNYFTLPDGYALDPNDVDGDGILNMFDLDSDNDGILDLNETGNDTYIRWVGTYTGIDDVVRDTDNDGRIDDMQDADADNIPDHIDHTFHPDETDADQDGIIDTADFDQIDSAGTTQTDAYGYVTTTQTFFDEDRNGIEDSQQPDRNNDGGFDYTVAVAPTAEDTDQDGIPPILDSDDNAAFNPPPTNPIAQTAANTTPSVGAANSGGSGGGTFGMWLLFMFFGLKKRLELMGYNV